MNNKIIAIIIVLVNFIFVTMVDAQTPYTNGNTAGAVLQQQLQERETLPEAVDANFEKPPEYKPALDVNGGLQVKPTAIVFSGDLLLNELELQAFAKPCINKMITVADLEQLCQTITDELRNRGYVVAQAYIPAQEIRGGTIEIAIVAGRYGTIKIVNKATIHTAVIDNELTALKKGDLIKSRSLERAILLINDLSGVNARAALSAGMDVGTSDLTITVLNAQTPSFISPLSFRLTYDNYGAYSIGQNEFGFNLNWENISNNGDELYFRFNSGGGNDLFLGALNYALPLGTDGGKLGAGYSQVNYNLNSSFSALNATGNADVASVNWSQPLQRSRVSNIYVNTDYDLAFLGNAQSPYNVKQSLNRVNIGMSGDVFGNYLVTAWSLTGTIGLVSLDSPDAINLDRVLGTSGYYTKLGANLVNNLYLADSLSLFVKASGQLSDKNLVSFEDFSLGGPYGVRAYGVGEATGDEGILGTVELRWVAPVIDFVPGGIQLSVFYDAGNVQINKNSYPGQGTNDVTLSGYGLGLVWSKADDFSLNTAYAWRASNQPSTVGGDPYQNGWFWLALAKNF